MGWGGVALYLEQSELPGRNALVQHLHGHTIVYLGYEYEYVCMHDMYLYV